MKATLILEGLEFRCIHGCLPKEKTHKQKFTVNFRAERDIDSCSKSDSLEDTTDMARLYDTISSEMMIPSNLLENLSARILKRIEENFPELESISIDIFKNNPPLPGKAKRSGIHIESER